MIITEIRCSRHGDPVVSVVKDAVFSFRCNACGQCCNSPPRLSLPEMFRYREIFIGCLAISHVQADNDQARCLQDTLFFPTAGAHIAITPQAYDYETRPHCPALNDDGHCALHAAGKPAQCQVVPLDPTVPDSLQHLVLRERMHDLAYQAGACIAPEAMPGATAIASGPRVVDPAFRTALHARRTAMVADRHVWGGVVFDMLKRELFATAAATRAIPQAGFMALPLVPALLVVAGFSEYCRSACVAFLESQLALIAGSVQRAVERRRAEERSTTQRLRGWADAYRALHATLSVAPNSGFTLPAEARASRDAWLGQSLVRLP